MRNSPPTWTAKAEPNRWGVGVGVPAPRMKTWATGHLHEDGVGLSSTSPGPAGQCPSARPQSSGMRLTAEEQEILAGRWGAPARRALEMQVATGGFFGAEAMVRISAAHLTGDPEAM